MTTGKFSKGTFCYNIYNLRKFLVQASLVYVFSEYFLAFLRVWLGYFCVPRAILVVNTMGNLKILDPEHFEHFLVLRDEKKTKTTVIVWLFLLKAKTLWWTDLDLSINDNKEKSESV